MSENDIIRRLIAQDLAHMGSSYARGRRDPDARGGVNPSYSENRADRFPGDDGPPQTGLAQPPRTPRQPVQDTEVQTWGRDMAGLPGTTSNAYAGRSAGLAAERAAPPPQAPAAPRSAGLSAPDMPPETVNPPTPGVNFRDVQPAAASRGAGRSMAEPVPQLMPDAAAANTRALAQFPNALDMDSPEEMAASRQYRQAQQTGRQARRQAELEQQEGLNQSTAKNIGIDIGPAAPAGHPGGARAFAAAGTLTPAGVSHPGADVAAPAPSAAPNTAPQLGFGDVGGAAAATSPTGFTPPASLAANPSAPRHQQAGQAGLHVAAQTGQVPANPMAPEMFDPETGQRSDEARKLGLLERVFGEKGSDGYREAGKALMMAGAAIMGTDGNLGQALANGIQAGLMTYDDATQALRDEEKEAIQMGMTQEAHELNMELKRLQLQRARQGPVRAEPALTPVQRALVTQAELESTMGLAPEDARNQALYGAGFRYRAPAGSALDGLFDN